MYIIKQDNMTLFLRWIGWHIMGGFVSTLQLLEWLWLTVGRLEKPCVVSNKIFITLLQNANELYPEMIDASLIIEESRKKKTHTGTEFYINTNNSDTILGISSLSGNI